jgi:hypothetical protein
MRDRFVYEFIIRNAGVLVKGRPRADQSSELAIVPRARVELRGAKAALAPDRKGNEGTLKRQANLPLFPGSEPIAFVDESGVHGDAVRSAPVGNLDPNLPGPPCFDLDRERSARCLPDPEAPWIEVDLVIERVKPEAGCGNGGESLEPLD